MRQFILVIFSFLLFFSCSNDDKKNTYRDFAGVWQSDQENASIEIDFEGDTGLGFITLENVLHDFSASIENGTLKLNFQDRNPVEADITSSGQLILNEELSDGQSLDGLTFDLVRPFAVFNPSNYDFHSRDVDREWYVAFNFNGNMTFEHIDGTEFTSIVSTLPTFNTADNRTDARAASDEGFVEIAISHDGASYYNDYQVLVTVNLGAQGRSFSSIGHFNGGYRLTGRWELSKVGGKEISRQEYGRSLPFINFNRGTRELTGFGGCNNFSSTYTYDSNQIYFREIISTRRTCQFMETEILLVDGLGNRNFRVSYTPNSVMFASRDYEFIFTRSN